MIDFIVRGSQIFSQNDAFVLNRQYLIVSFVFSTIICLPYLLSDILIFNYMDMYLYLKEVYKISNGEFELFVTRTRSNLFPLILYCWFSLFGFEVQALKVFYVLLLALLTFESMVIGTILYNSYIGILAAVLVATSYTFVHFAYFPHIDLLVLISVNFCLLLILYLLRCKKPSKWLYFVSGLTIAISYLIKESSIWLLLFLPVYTLLERLMFKERLKGWLFQVLPFMLSAGFIIYLSGQSFFKRYVGKLIRLLSVIFKGDNVHLMVQSNSGWKSQGLEHLSPIVKIPLFFIFPIYWQWNSVFPVPIKQICFEQLLLLIAFIFYVAFVKNHQTSKIFVISVLLIFMPRYIYAAISGSKIRQILPFVYIMYFPLSYFIYKAFQVLSLKVNRYGDSAGNIWCFCIVLIGCYIARILLVTNGIDYTLNYSSYEYHRVIPDVFLK